MCFPRSGSKADLSDLSSPSAKPRKQASSSATAEVSNFDRDPKGSMSSETALSFLANFKAPRTNPSTRKGPLEKRRTRYSLATTRVRSECRRQQIVVLRQESDRSWDIGIGPGNLGQVE